MHTDLKVTDQPEEIAFDDMVSGNQIINIPLFQRAFKWTEKNLNQFWDDIESIIDGSSKSHFLGVLVLVSQSRRVGQPVLLDIVDGQQRLTTCYLTIMAMVKIAAQNGHTDWAVEVARSFLLTRKFTNFSTNTKLIPSAADRQQFQKLWTQIANLPDLQDADWGGEPPSAPQPSGNETGRMTAAFRSLSKRVEKSYEEDGFVQIEKLFEIVGGKLSFVTINLRNPTAAPAIFERLNARGERINVSDLVRNEVFARVADDPMTAQSIFETHWEPFIEKFSTRNIELEKLLFPYGLCLDPNITKADLFQALRISWGEDLNPRAIIAAMDKHTPVFFALEAGDSQAIESQELRKILNDLHSLGAPSSIYSFAFQLLDGVKEESVSEDIAVRVLRMIETFLFRRAVAGYEPTGLHAVFKGLWDEAGKCKLTEDSVRKSISRRTTVPWPNDTEFKDSIENENLYSRRVVKYALQQYEISLSGESPQNEDFHIEHVLPQNPGQDWELEDADDRQTIINSWGNLIPLTSTMNPSVSNSGFTTKRQQYTDAVFATPRNLSREYENWNLQTIRSRSKKIAEWAIERWPHQRN